VCSSSKPASAAIRIARDALIRSQCWITRAEHGRVQASVDEVHLKIGHVADFLEIDDTSPVCREAHTRSCEHVPLAIEASTA